MVLSLEYLFSAGLQLSSVVFISMSDLRSFSKTQKHVYWTTFGARFPYVYINCTRSHP